MTVATQTIKLHLGCGTKRLDGYINIDSVAENKPDVVLDISHPLPYEDKSVDEILAEDLLEHFDKYMRYIVFYEWSRILKVGGKITIQVPNFKKILFKYFKFGYANFVDFIFGENLWEAEHYIGHFGNHKWGYCEESLREFVQIFGIETVLLEKKGLNLRLIGEKTRHVPLNEINQVKIHSFNNRFGSQKPCDISVAFIRERIRAFQDDLPTNHQ